MYAKPPCRDFPEESPGAPCGHGQLGTRAHRRAAECRRGALCAGTLCTQLVPGGQKSLQSPLVVFSAVFSRFSNRNTGFPKMCWKTLGTPCGRLTCWGIWEYGSCLLDFLQNDLNRAPQKGEGCSNLCFDPFCLVFKGTPTENQPFYRDPHFEKHPRMAGGRCLTGEPSYWKSFGATGLKAACYACKRFKGWPCFAAFRS